jgi:uncharacterized integral membrane protein (TIGR00698 family)
MSTRHLASLPAMDPASATPAATDPDAQTAAGDRRLGVAFAVVLAAVATLLANVAAHAGIVASPLVVALLLSLVLAQTARLPATLTPGLAFACRPLLRAAIVLLGFRLGFDGVATLGPRGVLALAVVVGGTIAGTLWIARRLRVSADLAWLLAAGHAICGAAAVAATDAVLRTRERDATLALALVTLLGTVAMLLCPLAALSNGIDAAHYGFWVGGSVHEVAQAVAAGYAAGPEHGDAASVVKLARVLFLVPFGVALSIVAARRARAAVAAGAARRGLAASIPWFVVGFAATAGLRATVVVPASALTVIDAICTFAMTTAMAALGARTRLRGIADAGARPVVVAAAATVLVSALALGGAFWAVG